MNALPKKIVQAIEKKFFTLSRNIDFSVASKTPTELKKKNTAKQKVLLIVPDFTRYSSGAGELTCRVADILNSSADVYILPATGTHRMMTKAETSTMYPKLRVLPHDVASCVPSGAVLSSREINKAFPNLPQTLVRDVPLLTSRYLLMRSLLEKVCLQKNKQSQLCGDDFSMVMSIGSVVPHEVVGMANYTKNIVIGLGGHDLIDITHFGSAMLGMRNLLGQAENPVRSLLNKATSKLAKHAGFAKKLCYLLSAGKPFDLDENVHGATIDKEVSFLQDSFTVENMKSVNASRKSSTTNNSSYDGLNNISSVKEMTKLSNSGSKVLESDSIDEILFFGSSKKVFKRAALATEKTIVRMGRTFPVVIVQLPFHVHNLWIGNKAIYRAGGMVSHGGKLVVLAPGLSELAYNEEANRIISELGYMSATNVQKYMNEKETANSGRVNNKIDLTSHLAVTAHLIHGFPNNYTVHFAINKSSGNTSSTGISPKLIKKIGYYPMKYAKAVKMRSEALHGSLVVGGGVAVSKHGEVAVVLQDPALGLFTK